MEAPKSAALLPPIRSSPPSEDDRGGGSGKVSPARAFVVAPAQPEVTRFACEMIELSFGMHEIHGLYRDDDSVHFGEMRSEENLSDPRLAKAQRAFNSLQGRVTSWTKEEDPRFARVFYGMITAARSPSRELEIPAMAMEEVHALIGKKNVIDSSPFDKYGIICLKDHAIPEPRPHNVVTKKELKEMRSLRRKLKNENALKKIHIEGGPGFRREVLVEFEKMLTFPEGRELVKRLYASKKPITISEGKESGESCNRDGSEIQVTLSLRPFQYIGQERDTQTLTRSSSWFIFAHELTHALHHAEDVAATAKRQHTSTSIHPLWGNHEEHLTIGDPANIPRLSENAFREKTFYPLRNFHTGLTHNSSVDDKIDVIFSCNLDQDLINLLEQRPLISVTQLQTIARTKFAKSKPHLLQALIRHPHFKSVVTVEILKKCVDRSIKKGWATITTEIEENFPTKSKQWGSTED